MQGNSYREAIVAEPSGWSFGEEIECHNCELIHDQLVVSSFCFTTVHVTVHHSTIGQRQAKRWELVGRSLIVDTVIFTILGLVKRCPQRYLKLPFESHHRRNIPRERQPKRGGTLVSEPALVVEV